MIDGMLKLISEKYNIRMAVLLYKRNVFLWRFQLYSDETTNIGTIIWTLFAQHDTVVVSKER